MQITILCAGRLRERYWQEAAAEYIKRMGRYRKLEIIEVPDQPEGPQAMKKEGEAMLAHLRPDDYVEQLGARVVFVIGGSLGLHEDVIQRADQRLSMSPMTFPHQLARIMLLEQIYRAHKINAGEKYHK